MREMMECTAGKATPSPSPNATRASSSCGAPARAAAGVRKVASDQAPRPAARTGLPPRRSAICPPCWRAHSRRGRASARVEQVRVRAECRACACQHLRGGVADEEAGEHPPANGCGSVAQSRQHGRQARLLAGAPAAATHPSNVLLHPNSGAMLSTAVLMFDRSASAFASERACRQVWRTGATFGAPAVTHTR